MHVTVVVKCEICYLFPFDSCWCIQSYCNPDTKDHRQVNPYFIGDCEFESRNLRPTYDRLERTR